MNKQDLLNTLTSVRTGVAKLASLGQVMDSKLASVKQAGFNAAEHDAEQIKALTLEYCSKLAQLGITEDEYVQESADHMAQGHVSTLRDAVSTLDYLLGGQSVKQASADNSLGRVVETGRQTVANQPVVRQHRC
jgi:hypothetical protein